MNTLSTMEKSILEAGGETGRWYEDHLHVTPEEEKTANVFLQREHSVRVKTQRVLRAIRESFNTKTQYYQWTRELKSRIPDRNIRDTISAFLQRCNSLSYKEGGKQRAALLYSLPMEGELTHWVCTQMPD